MQKRSKRYKKAAEMIPAGKVFSLEEAADRGEVEVLVHVVQLLARAARREE